MAKSLKKILKAKREQAEEIAYQRSFGEEKQYATNKIKQILTRPDKAPKNEKDQELNHQRFLKRWALLVALGGIKIKDDEDNIIDAKNFQMPIAQIMSCGTRINIINHNNRDDGDKILNWLLSKTSTPKNLEKPYRENPNISRTNKKTKGQLAHTRKGGTHGFDGETEIKQKLWKSVNYSGAHLGVDLALGEYGEKDIHERPITLDGLSGHAYIHVDPKSQNILLGMEQCTEPKIHNPKGSRFTVQGEFATHNLLGGSHPITAIGTISFGKYPKDGWPENLPRDDKKKRKRAKYNCMKINLDATPMPLKDILALNPDDFSNDIVEALPCSTIEDVEKFKKQYQHTHTQTKQDETILDKIENLFSPSSHLQQPSPKPQSLKNQVSDQKTIDILCEYLEEKLFPPTATAQTKVIKKFEQHLESQKPKTVPNGAYSGIGLIMDYDEDEKSLAIEKVVDKPKGRFAIDSKPVQDHNILAGKFITKIKIGSDERETSSLSAKEIATILHQNSQDVTLTILDKANNSTQLVTCKASRQNTFCVTKNSANEVDAEKYNPKKHGTNFLKLQSEVKKASSSRE